MVCLCERSLQSARESSLMRIVNALETYTGLDYGLDAEAWKAWADSGPHGRAKIHGLDSVGPLSSRQRTHCDTLAARRRDRESSRIRSGRID